MAEARVTIVGTEMEAQIACGMLRAEGIACGYRLVESIFDAEGSGGGVLPGRHEIIVDPADLAHARQLVGAEQFDATCVECDRRIGDDGRWHSDGAGDFVPYCAGCAEREFGPAA